MLPTSSKVYVLTERVDYMGGEYDTIIRGVYSDISKANEALSVLKGSKEFSYMYDIQDYELDKLP